MSNIPKMGQLPTPDLPIRPPPELPEIIHRRQVPHLAGHPHRRHHGGFDFRRALGRLGRGRPVRPFRRSAATGAAQEAFSGKAMGWLSQKAELENVRKRVFEEMKVFEIYF